MTTTTNALQIPAARAPFEAATIPRRALRDDDVAIDIHYCGICHSDLHQAHADWGRGLFPIVPGHEIAGVVTAVGGAVARFAVGDRVGVGVLVDSCGACAPCGAGDEPFCERGAIATYNGVGYDGERTKGGYSGRIVVGERHVVTVPDALGLDVAAPLLCAGITMYNPLTRWGAGPGRRVAIVGLGGLGHVGVQIAAALGAEVTALTRTLDKAGDARRFGAAHCHATSDPETFTTLAGRFDLIVSTIAANVALDDYLDLLVPRGTLVAVGLPTAPDTLHVGSLIGRERVLTGANVGGLAQTQEMLDFCAAHGVAPAIEVLPAEAAAVDVAYARLARGDVRYRFVLDVGALR